MKDRRLTLLAATINQYRVYPQAYWYYGPFGVMGEYLVSSQELLSPNKNGDKTTRQDNIAWNAAASYVLTGEANSFLAVKPDHPFDPGAGNWGAFELVTRWSEFDIDDDTFKYKGVFANPTKSVSHATSWAAGLNWWLNENLKIMSTYEQTYFEGGASRLNNVKAVANRPDEKVFFTRFQVAF